MNKTINFFRRNLKEVLRDPIIYIFCLGFPVVMFLLFYVINKFSAAAMPVFTLPSLVPGIMVFSFSFVMLTLALVVSKDKQSCFLKRLYSSTMKPFDFIGGYSLVGFVIGLLQMVVCVITGWVFALIGGTDLFSVGKALLLMLSQLPMLIINVFLGIWFGTIFSDKSAPGICSVFISLSGILGGCWMPLETMGAFATFCRVLPFYPSVIWGRIITGAQDTYGNLYTFDHVAGLGLIPVIVCLVASITFAVFTFRKNMVSDK